MWGLGRLVSLDAAKSVPDGYVVLDGEFGGVCYLVYPARLTKCKEESLRLLAHDLEDAIFDGDTSGAGVHFERLDSLRAKLALRFR